MSRATSARAIRLARSGAAFLASGALVVVALSLAVSIPAPRRTSPAIIGNGPRTPGGHCDDGTDAAEDHPDRRIVLRGFAAVPDLIRLLQDRRLTVHESPADM